MRPKNTSRTLPEKAVFIHRPNCELCGSDRKTTLLFKQFTDPAVWDFLESYYERRISRDSLTNGKYEIVKCCDCGFIWQAYILDDEWMERLYDTWISSQQSLNKKKCADISLFSAYARQVEIIAYLLSGKSPFEINVLDFGMGWGYWCLMAKAFGYNVWGFELSEERIDFAAKNGIDVIENLSSIGSPKFDFINAEQVFEHIPNPLETLKLLAHSLRHKGIIRITVPNGRGIEQELSNVGWKATKNAIQPLEHINCFMHSTLIRLGESAGLVVMKPPFLSGHRHNCKSYIKGVLGKYYEQFFGTQSYFKIRE